MSGDFGQQVKDNPLLFGIAGGFATAFAIWGLTGLATLGAGIGIFVFVWISGRFNLLAKQIGLNVGEADRGLQDGFGTSQKDADNYWSTYDPGKIWEQRALELEAVTSGGGITHYDLMRQSIPELASNPVMPSFVNLVPMKTNEPLRDFWARYDRIKFGRVGYDQTSGNHDDMRFPIHEEQSPRVDREIDYSHLPPHLARIAETEGARGKLSEAARQETGELGADLDKMVTNVDTIIAAIRANPTKLGDVQRLFTYYLPEVGKLLEARRLVLSTNDTTLLGEIDAILDRIGTAFKQFAARMHEADIRALDIDLKLLDQSLAAEFETKIGS